MQMREAIGMVETYRDDYLPVVMRTFVWAIPLEFRAPADSGARILLDLTAGGAWDLTSDGTGRWVLDQHVGGDDAYVATIPFDDDAGWRWLTGGSPDLDRIQRTGPDRLLDPLMQVRGILV